MTPYEAYYGTRPDISHLREIGCWAFVLNQSKRLPKIHNKSIEGILMGYSWNSKAYRCYYPKTSHIIVSRNVFFIELKDNQPRSFWPGVEIGDLGDNETVGDPFKQIQTEQEHEKDNTNNVEIVDERNDNEPQENITPDNIPISHKSKRLLKLSAAGAAMKGVAHMTNLERKLQEMKETHEQCNDHAHVLDDKIMVASVMEVNKLLA